MALRVRGSGDFVVGSLTAVLVAGLVYVGVLLLTDAQAPTDVVLVEGAIRIAEAQKDAAVEPVKRKKIEEQEPPKKLPKTFSSKAQPKEVMPVMQLNAPQFSADMHPGMKGGISMPSGLGDLGGIGFSMDEVDEVPRVVRSVPPEYPYSAKRNNVEGKVVVRMLVTSEGTPANLTIQSASPEGVFETAALAAAKRWKFQPGQYNGRAVDTWVLLPFNFELKR